MKRAWPLMALIVGTVLLAALVLWPRVMGIPGRPVIIGGTAVPPVPTLDAQMVAQGQPVYAQHCASCHGANLEGAPNWKEPLPDGTFPPPPHDSSGHTWHHADGVLIKIILGGGDPAYNSKMPAFAGKLTEAEVHLILEFIKSHWGQEERDFQWWVTVTKEQP